MIQVELYGRARRISRNTVNFHFNYFSFDGDPAVTFYLPESNGSQPDLKFL